LLSEEAGATSTLAMALALSFYTSHPTISLLNFESCFPPPKQSGISGRMFSTRQDFKGSAVISQFAYISQSDCGRNLEADKKG